VRQGYIHSYRPNSHHHLPVSSFDLSAPSNRHPSISFWEPAEELHSDPLSSCSHYIPTIIHFGLHTVTYPTLLSSHHTPPDHLADAIPFTTYSTHSSSYCSTYSKSFTSSSDHSSSESLAYAIYSQHHFWSISYASTRQSLQGFAIPASIRGG
jgi:hypothetical protein